jgi:hypothetical protein
MQTELLLVVIAKGLIELAGMFLLGRGLLYLLAGAKRETNIFYQVLSIVTNPVIRAARWITPRVIVDRHIPLVAFVLLAWAWLAIVFWVLPELCASGRVDCTPLLERKSGR